MTPMARLETIGERIAEQLTPIATRQEVGKQLGICGERVRQIERVALGRVAVRLREKLKEYADDGDMPIGEMLRAMSSVMHGGDKFL